MRTPAEKYLDSLTRSVTHALAALDEEMLKPSSVQRGKKIALICNLLQVQNDLAKRFGLGLGRKEKSRLSAAVKKHMQGTDKKILRIQDATDEPGGHWIERYFLQDKMGRFRELKHIPGNGQYAPDVLEILTWFVRLGVTHVQVMEGWHETVPAKTYPLKIFAQHMRRVSKDS